MQGSGDVRELRKGANKFFRKMDEERLKRYGSKIELILNRSDEIKEWTSIGPEDFIKDEKTKLATYKAFQEAVEASMNIIAMLCKDLKIIPKDDYTNIENLKGKIFSEDMGDALIECNGLRNRLIHHYNKMDDLLAFDGITGILPELKRFTDTVKEWIRKELKE